MQGVSNTAQIQTWFNRAQIDYVKQYMALYAAFNAWYSERAHSNNDRQALNALREGCSIWELYCGGKSMRDLGPYMKLLIEYTQRQPLSYATPHWKGEVAHIQDWQGLVEYWYRARCLVMHGAEIDPTYVYLAYETLNIFMSEVLRKGQD